MLSVMFADVAMQWQARWAGAAIGWQILGWLVCLVPPALVILLYRAELRLVRFSVARSLLAVRLSSIAAVIAVVAFQPVIHTTSTESIRGRVLVALDRSQSMTVVDPQRPLADKLRIVRALKLAGDLCSDRQLDTWIEEAAKGDVAFPGGSGATDDQARQSFSRVVQRIDALSRGQLGVAVLGENGGLLTAIEQNHDATLLGFSDSASPIKRDGLSQLAPPTGAGTDLAAPLDAANSGGDSPTVAIVLLADGRHTADASPVPKAAALGKAGVPVYSVVLGSRMPPSDLAIARVQAPATVFKGAGSRADRDRAGECPERPDHQRRSRAAWASADHRTNRASGRLAAARGAHSRSTRRAGRASTDRARSSRTRGHPSGKRFAHRDDPSRRRSSQGVID